MLNNQLEVIKTAFKDKKKRTQNLILLVVLLVLLLVASNYIFKDNTDKKTFDSNNISEKDNINSSSSNNVETSKKQDSTSSDMEQKLSTILSQIQGISDASIVLSYSEESKQNVVYNTKESSKSGESTSEKVVAYNEQSGNKSAVVESVECPKVEGAIVVAKGANSVDIRSKIANAVATLVNIPAYKVQVFEKQG